MRKGEPWRFTAASRSIAVPRRNSAGALLPPQQAGRADWTRYAIATLIFTNAALVFFDLSAREGWGSLGRTKADAETKDASESSSTRGGTSSRVTAEELESILSEDVERYAVRIRRRHITKGHGLQGFVLFSSYRISHSSFAALGLSPLTLHSIFRSNMCRWDDGSGVTINGTVQAHYPGEAFRMQYESIILVCTLDAPMPALSRHPLNSSTSYNATAAADAGASVSGSSVESSSISANSGSSSADSGSRARTEDRGHSAVEFEEQVPLATAWGGNLTMKIDGTDSVVYQEPPGTPLLAELPQSFPHVLAHCSSPIARPLHAERVRQWMQFHNSIHGIDYFVLYDAGGLDDDVAQVVQGWAQKGMAEVRDMRDTTQYDSYHYSQLLAINDCVYRTRFIARWTIYLEFDQYLSLPLPAPAAVAAGVADATDKRGGGVAAGASPPAPAPAAAAATASNSSAASTGSAAAVVAPSLLSFLQEKGNGSLPWMSFGCYIYSVHHCAPLPDVSDGDEWAVERLVFREREPYCRSGSVYASNKAQCQKAEGQRKFVVNPRRVVANQINRVLSGDRGGYNAPTWAVRINHFRGLVEIDRTLCDFAWEDGTGPPRLERDPIVAAMAVASRKRLHAAAAAAQNRTSSVEGEHA